jgi:hypothetical protein
MPTPRNRMDISAELPQKLKIINPLFVHWNYKYCAKARSSVSKAGIW